MAERQSYRCRNCSGVVMPVSEENRIYGFDWVHEGGGCFCPGRPAAYPDYDKPLGGK